MTRLPNAKARLIVNVMEHGADAARSEATRTRMPTATGLLRMEALGTFRGARKTGGPMHEGDTGPRT